MQEKSGPRVVGARFCPYCGASAVPGGSFCPACGASLSGDRPLGAPTGPGAPLGPPFTGLPGAYPSGWGRSEVPSPASRSVDHRALSSVITASLVGLIGIVVGFVALFTTNASLFAGVTTNNGGGSLALQQSGLSFLIVASGSSLIFTLIELIYYREAFHTLSPVDPQFKTPSTLVLLLLVMLVIVFALVIGVFVELASAIACAAGNPITSTCINAGATLDLVGAIGVALIVVLIGYIGLLVGIWRLGTRYGELMFKIGAIMTIIPVLNIVGVILVFIAARSARSRLEPVVIPTTFG